MRPSQDEAGGHEPLVLTFRQLGRLLPEADGPVAHQHLHVLAPGYKHGGEGATSVVVKLKALGAGEDIVNQSTKGEGRRSGD